MGILGDLIILKDGWGPLLEGRVSSQIQETMHLRKQGLRNQCLGLGVRVEASWWGPGESCKAASWKESGLLWRKPGLASNSSFAPCISLG